MADSLVVLTRARAKSEQLATQLQQNTSLPMPEIRVLPLMTETARPPRPADNHLIQNLDQFDHIIFISQNAVMYGLPLLEAYWPQWPLGLRWFAVGPTTASALASHDIPAITPDIASSEGLLALEDMAESGACKTLIVRGVGGRETLKETLVKRGFDVHYLEVYERLAVDYSSADLELPDIEVKYVLVYSGEALNHLVQLYPVTFQSFRVLVPSQRLQTVAFDLGFDKVRTAHSQTDDDMLLALQTWRTEEEC